MKNSFAAFIFLFFCSSCWGQQLIGTRTSSPSQLYSIDPETADSKLVAELDGNIAGITLDTTSNLLYGTTIDGGALVTVDPANGETRLVGSTGIFIQDLAFDSNSRKLYGCNPNSSFVPIWEIDRCTGIAEPLGSFFIDTGQALGVIESIAIDSIGNRFFGTLNGFLVRLDLANKTAEILQDNSIIGLSGLAYDETSQKLYGCSRLLDQLFEINTETGEGTLIGDTGVADCEFLTFDPQASPNVLLGDVNLDGEINLLDVQPFIESFSDCIYSAEADVNTDGFIDLLDVAPFVELLTQ